MTVARWAQDLVGSWTGTKRVWLTPGQETFQSPSTAEVAPLAQGQFMSIAYTWETDGGAQDGIILFATRNGEAKRSVWLDSWHVGSNLMLCESTRQTGAVTLRGSYSAPSGPDWGWRIEIEPGGRSGLVIRMFNITPLGVEALAVLAEYERQPR